MSNKSEMTPLQYLGYKYEGTNNIPNDELLKNDVTEELYATIRISIEKGLQMPMCIIGATTSGKSAVALTLAKYMNDLIEKKQNKKIDMYKCIASDQLEYNRLINQPEADGKPKEWKCLVCDEFSKLGESGANATVEANTFTTWQDIGAQAYLYTIFCSPRAYYQTTAVYSLTCMGRGNDPNKQTTLLKIEYRSPAGIMIPIGSVNVDVTKTLQSNWYKQYRKKKKERLNLLRNHGVPDVRELESSKIAYEVYQELKNLTIAGKALNNFVKLTSREVLQRNKLPYSLIARGEMIEQAQGLLSAQAELHKLKEKRMTKIKTPTQEERLNKTIQYLQEKIQHALNKLKADMKILEEYNNIQ